MSQPLTILVVEDDLELRRVLIDILAPHYQVLSADDGAAAWSQIETSSSEIDLVLTDIQMPVLDGVGLLKRIKHQYPHIGVIMISGIGDVDIAVESMRKGAFDYISKPVKGREELLRVIKRWQAETG